MHMMGAPHEIQIPDPCLVVLVGAAGAGKSTFAARHFDPGEVLSSDTFREMVSGDAADQRATRPAFAALHRALTTRLSERRLTVVDATSVTASARAALLKASAAAGLPAVAIVLDLPEDVVLARNIGRRGRTVPADAIRRQHLQLSAATAAGRLEREGFAAVYRLSDPAVVGGVRIVRTR